MKSNMRELVGAELDRVGGGSFWEGLGDIARGVAAIREGAGDIRNGSVQEGLGDIRYGVGSIAEGAGDLRHSHA